MSEANHHCLFSMPVQTRLVQTRALLQARSSCCEAAKQSVLPQFRGTEGRHRGDQWIGGLDVDNYLCFNVVLCIANAVFLELGASCATLVSSCMVFLDVKSITQSLLLQQQLCY